ncbi:MAG: hypothetical protein GY754_28565 [bacterium]|nr:hypothetical protein [bacterium]
MKIRKFRKILTLVIAFGFIVTAVTGQEKNPTVDDSTLQPDGTYTSKTLDEAERPEDSYLAKFHARDIVHKLVKRNLDQIYLLKVVVSNFKEYKWEEDYKKCYQGYKDAMELSYRRNLIYARQQFENNRKDISNLMLKMTDQYKKDTLTMLNECAEKIMELHLDAQTRSDPNKNRNLINNQMRLRIAYGQFDDASSACMEKNYEAGIYHYRVAKTFGVKILQDIVPPEERKEVKKKYKYVKADNLNRIYDIKKAAKPAADKPASP